MNDYILAEADADTEDDAPEMLPPTKGDCPALRLEREKRAIRKQLLAADLARLVCVQRLSFKEAAAELGVSYRHAIGNLWPMARESAMADMLDPAEKERIALMISDTLQHVVRTAADKMGENAAYGMVALNGCKQMAEMHGIDFQARADGGALASLEAVAAEVLEHAPMLAGRLKSLQFAHGQRLESNSLDAAGY